MRFTMFLASTMALLAVVGTQSTAASAQDLLKQKTYYFGTHPARTNVTFVSEADLETIHGVSHAMAGSITVDASGKKASGSLRVGVGALRTGIAKRDEHLRSDAWLDARKYPYIRLQVVSAVEGTDGKTWAMTARITIKGVTKAMTSKAKVRAIPAKLGQSLGAGSWVRVRTKFVVKLADFNIKVPQMVGSKVSQTWDIGVDVYGTTAAPKKAARR